MRSFVYTDADRDGMLEGPDLDDVRAVAGAVRGRFVYSGGIGTTEHLRSLVSLRLVNLAGAAFLAVRFIRRRTTLHRLERWQATYLPVFALWAATVVVVIPPLFGFE